MSRNLQSFCTAFFLLFPFANNLMAQQMMDKYEVRMKGTSVYPLANAQAWFDSVSVHNKTNKPIQVLLQFFDIPTQAQREQLKGANIVLMDYFPNYAYSAIIRFPSNFQNITATGIKSVVDMNNDWKIDTRLNSLDFQLGNRIKLLVSFAKTMTIDDARELLDVYDATISNKLFEPVSTFEIEIAQDQINAFATEAIVKYVSLPMKSKPLNDQTRGATGAEILHAPIAVGGYNLDGTGTTVGVGDLNTSLIHVDTRDRTINFNPLRAAEHGIHVAGSVGGKGILDPKAEGIAPNTTLITNIFEAIWATTPAMLHAYNMTVTNNSYAAIVNDSAYAGVYDLASKILDEYELDYPEVQHVFAAGNDGLYTWNGYAKGYNTVTGAYQSAKNVLTVGAFEKTGNVVWEKSSRGPVKDGRLKPEVIVNGARIYSCSVNDTYAGINGTSNAAPQVAGGLALLTQRYKQKSGSVNPPSDLMKALTMNGAVDMGNPGPDFLYGYGYMNLFRSLKMLDNNQYLLDSLNNGDSNVHNITVPANTAQVKIMLYWHDASANPSATTTLVNNLDLRVNEPNATLHRPLILDPSPANVGNVAVEGIDNRNNSEQVVINNPGPGNYTVTVKGSMVPMGKQHYVVVYDFVTDSIKVKYPTTAMPFKANDSSYIYWDANPDPNSFTISFFDGSNWSVLSNNVPSSSRQFRWNPIPNVSTDKARIAISRNSTAQSDTTGVFVLNPEPVVQLDANQCPGYIAINWNAVANATGYEILQKVGADMNVVDTVMAPGISYVFKGLALDSEYYVAVRPLINGIRGYRSWAVKRIPNDGNCTGSISDGDLMADAILNFNSGRKYTSTELSANETLSVRVRNLDDQVANNYRVSYSLNGGAWQSQTSFNAIAAGGTTTVNFSGLDLSAIGNYDVKVAVEHLGMNDFVKRNDTLVKHINHLKNDTVDLNNGFADDFETMPVFSFLRDSSGISPNDHWDYANSMDSGRIWSFLSEDITISGQRSISMDALYNLFFVDPAGVQNYFTGTFNLGGYDTSTTEARIEFDYKFHGRPKFESGNEVWIRGNDSEPWLSLMNFDTAAVPGSIKKTGSLSLTNSLHQNGQNFSSSFQVRIGQHDTSSISMNDYGNGLTIDNFRLYSVKNDVQLVSVVAPAKFECGLNNITQLFVKVYNSDNLPQSNIQLNYRLDNGPVFTDTLLGIAPKDTVLFVFSSLLPVAVPGYHTLDVWLVANGDTYLPNDSILNYRFRNQPLISQFPYLENFENGEGYWYAEGVNNSWEYGMPASFMIKKAASGSKAWMTNLTGNYKDKEESYLYSPCFDISELANPMLSFSLSTDIENCGGQLCDGAHLEYSDDGVIWTKLGNSGEGFNWYGNLEVWNDQDKVRWRVASIPLPKDMTALKLRFVFHSDAGASRDGIAIDDIHVFDLKNVIYNDGTVAATKTVQGVNLVDFTTNNQVLAQINPSRQNLGNTELGLYKHSFVLHPITNQYNLSRNYTVKAAQPPSDSVTLRLFITDDEVLELIMDNSCDTCKRADDAYRLGITQYTDPDVNLENGALSDNINGTYSFIPYTNIQWVPYERGYYAQTKVKSFSEFWFNTYLTDKFFAGNILYPNPVTDKQIHIIWSGDPGSLLSLRISDMAGRVVYRANANATASDNKTTFHLPALATGMYIVRYIAGSQTAETKLLIR